MEADSSTLRVARFFEVTTLWGLAEVFNPLQHHARKPHRVVSAVCAAKL